MLFLGSMPPLKQFNYSIFIIFFCCALSSTGFAQNKILKGYIKDGLSDERIPFASVSFIGSKAGKLSDSAGNFAFRLHEWPSDTLLVTYVGYRDFKIALDTALIAKYAKGDVIEIPINMERGKLTNEVIVKKKVDRGLLMWRRIVRRKPFNDRYRFNNFSYELYNKLELDLNRINKDKVKSIGPIRPFSFLLNNIDTSEGAPFLPVYLTETVSDYYAQKSPFKSREIIKGSKTMGLNNESVSKFLGGTDQNVNIYANFIPVFDKQFVSPLSDNGDAYYRYRVADTQYVGNQRYFHLIFQPKRKGENTFEGDCWVHDTTWAIQRMNLFLAKDANINFVEKLHLLQEYTLVNDSTWFLSKDKFVVDIAPIKTTFGFIGRKTTTYKNVAYNQQSITDSLNKNKIKQEVFFADGARQQKDEYWKDARHDSLSKNEKAVYSMIDTLQKMPLFKRYVDYLNFLGTGYYDIGNYEIGPWYNWYTYNTVEGSRVRFDLGTNKHFSKDIILHGYLAYGFLDQKFKYKLDAMYLFKKHPRMSLYASYFSDFDRGQYYYDEISGDNLFALAIRKSGVPIKFLFKEEGRVDFFKEWVQGFSVTLSAAHAKYDPVQNLPPKQTFPDPLINFEASIKLRYAYLEKFFETSFYRTSLGSPYPIIDFKFSKGIAGVLNSQYNYTRFSASVSDYLKIPPFGSLYYNFFAGKTNGTLPFMLLDLAPGNEVYYYNKYAYNLMVRYEYVLDRYAGFNFEHNIGNGIFKYVGLTRRWKFRQFYTVKGLWGTTTDANKTYNKAPGYNFKSLDGKTYVEVGTGVDNIFKVFRIDAIWRLLPTPLPESKTAKFGIFFSFRLAF